MFLKTLQSGSGGGGGNLSANYIGDVIWQGNQYLRLQNCKDAKAFVWLDAKSSGGYGIYGINGKVYRINNNDFFGNYIVEGNDIVVQGVYTSGSTNYTGKVVAFN